MSRKIISKNKRASYDYLLEEKIEVGIVLRGTEVKSLRQGKVSLTESFINIDASGEAWICNMNIAHYEFGNIHNHETSRKRKLLMHKRQIEEYAHRAKAGGYTIVPCSLYFRKGRVKLEMALGKGKKKHDKRQAEAKKDAYKRLRRGDYD